jgi:Ni/Fe-hydrogenase 1 B-type cytochrome subunit
MAEQIRRVAVWSGRLRLVHWLLACSAVALFVTGWLIDAAPSLAKAASDYHYIAASILTLALLLRVWLGFFGSGPERFEHLLLSATELRGVRDSLVFYLSFGRAPMPAWYAHNPLWKSLYLILFLLLAGLVVTGWLMPETPLIGRLYLPRVHAGLSSLTVLLLVLHVFSVVLQDLRGQSADASAMLSGNRYFSIDRDGLVKPEVPEVSVRIDDIDRR